jgi:3-oxoacyl-[acyl-carrier protein] reductase
MKIQDCNILITGGARGIGNFLALHLMEKAQKIFVIDNNVELLNELPKSDKLVYFVCNITNPEELEIVIRQIFELHGGVDICINNAGIIHSEPLINLLGRPDRKHNILNWQKVIDVNLSAVFYVTMNVADQMIAKKRKGVIINISSISAQGNIGQSAYSASKAGVEALTKTWSKELSMFGIRSACIAPGFFDTPSTKEKVNTHMLEKWEKSIPLKRLGVLEELLTSVEFIITNDYYNGKILSIDGGLNI